MGNTTGIVSKGELIDLICIDCKKEFKDHINVVTIKGKSPPPEKCKECRDKDLLKAVKNLADHFAAQDAVKTISDINKTYL